MGKARKLSILTPVWSAAPAVKTVRQARSMCNPASVAPQPSLTACWGETAVNAAADLKQMTQARPEATAVAAELFV